MNQEKIGKFIAERRKLQALTQMQLAERLGVSDRAVSKWERGKCMPDVSIMQELCRELGISVNDLLCGEVVLMENYNEKMEKNLMELAKEKERADKMLLFLEIFVGVLCTAILVAATMVASYVQMEEWKRVLVVVIGMIPLLIAFPFLLKIEQTAGYYQCGACGHKYVPTFKAINLSMHMGRTRHMRCPNCGKKSWQKKVISKD